MALGITLRSHTTNGQTSTQTHTSSSFTPSANSKLYVAVVATASSHTSDHSWTLTDSLGSSFTPEYLSAEVAWVESPNFDGRIGLYSLDVGASPSARTVTLDPFAGAQSALVSMMVFDVTGDSPQIRNPGTPQLVGNIASKTGDSNVSHASGALGAACISGNLTVAVFGGADAGPAATPSGWSVLATQGTADWSNVNIFYRTDFTGTSVTCTDCGTETGLEGSVLFEIEEAGAAAPTPPYFDDFDRSDAGDLGPNWLSGEWDIVSNRAVRNPSGFEDFAVYLHDIGSTDMWVAADTVTTSSYAVINVRRSVTNSEVGYLGFWSPADAHWHIGRQSGGYTDLVVSDSWAGSWAGNLRLEAEGAELRLYADYELVASTTDSSITTGSYAGINGNAGAVLDNWEAGSLLVLTHTDPSSIEVDEDVLLYVHGTGFADYNMIRIEYPLGETAHWLTTSINEDTYVAFETWVDETYPVFSEAGTYYIIAVNGDTEEESNALPFVVTEPVTYEITPIGSANEWQPTDGRNPTAALIDVDGSTTRWLVTYQSGASFAASAVVHEIDGAGAVTVIGTPLQWGGSGINEAMPINAVGSTADQALVVYRSTDADGFARALAINPSTWEVTAGGAELEFDLLTILSPSMVNLHDDIFFVAYRGDGNDGFAAVLGVASGTTSALGALEFDTVNCISPAVARIDDDHALVVYEGNGADGFAMVVNINPSTFACTQVSLLEFDTVSGQYNTVDRLDASHYLVTWTNTTDVSGYAQVLAVNPSTYAITALGTPTAISATAVTVSGERATTCAVMNHTGGAYNVVRSYRDGAPRVFLDILKVNDSTWTVTLIEDKAVDVGVNYIHPEIKRITDTRFALWWHESTTNDGFVQTFNFVGGAGGDTDATATPSSVSMALTTPSAVTGAGGSRTPTVMPLSTTTPAVSPSVPVTRTTSFIALSLIPQAQNIVISGTRTPAFVALSLTSPAPTISFGGSRQPATSALVLTLPATAASGGASVTASPSFVSLALATQAPALSFGTSPTPSVIALALTVPSAFASGGTSVAAQPGAVALIVTPQAPSLQFGSAKTPAVISVPMTLPAAVRSASGTRSPSAALMSMLLGVPAPGGGAITAPAHIALGLVLPTTTKSGGGTVLPGSVLLVTTLPASSASGVINANVAPAVLFQTLALPTPTIVIGSAGVVIPATISLALALNTVDVLRGATATPGPIFMQMGSGLVAAAPITLLNEATGIWLGTVPIIRVWLGNDLVWERP